MKKFFFLALILICIVSLFSCSELINNGQKPSNGQGNPDISSGNNNSSEGTPPDKPSGGTKPGTSTGDKDTSGDATSVAVTVYIDGSKNDTIYTDSRHGYTITPPKKPEDITTNPNSEKYFYGWFVDPNFQTPLFETTKFQNGGAIYGKWITVYSNSFKYTVNYGKATITGFTDNAPTVLVIPAYINSFPVVGIGQDAFKGKTTIRTVILCNGIETIGGFNGCNSIEKVDIPTSVTKIGTLCFANCGFSKFKIPSQITEIGASAFSGCNRLTSITIPNSVTSIGEWAFEDCTGLTSITIPNSVTSIGDSAFSGCTGFKSIAIPNGVASIGDSAFV